MEHIGLIPDMPNAEYHASVSIINERLSKLLAIEHTA